MHRLVVNLSFTSFIAYYFTTFQRKGDKQNHYLLNVTTSTSNLCISSPSEDLYVLFQTLLYKNSHLVNNVLSSAKI